MAAALDLPMAQQDEGTQGTQPQQPAAPAPAPQAQQAVPTTVVNPALTETHPGDDGTGTGAPASGQEASTQQASQQPTSAVKPVAQSEPTPAVSGAPGGNQERPVLDPRPLMWLKQNEPQKYDLVNQIAQERGVSPQRLAFHWMTEGGFQEDAPRGQAGEWGPVQVMPGTAKNFNDGGKLDMTHPIDNLRIGANYMRYLDQKYGKDSPSSIGAYQGGEGSMSDMAAHPDMAMKNHPNTVAYMQRAFPGFNIGPQSVTGESKMTFQGAVQAGSQGGPQGFLQYITSNAPEGMTMTDAWRHVEGMLVQAQLAKGDIVGAQHARDFVMQMAYTGANQNLMQAYQHMQAGDAVGAGQFLARSHAFFPDGTMGRFGVDQQGQLWGQRIDEHNPGRVLGSFKIDANGIAGMLNQTMDPQKFLGTLLEQQKVAIQGRHQELLGQHYADEAQHYGDQAAAAEDRANNAEARANETARHNRQEEQLTEELRKTQAARSGDQKQLHSAVDKEVSGLYGPDMDQSDPGTRSTKAQIYKAARIDGGADPVTAEHIAGGLSDHTLKLLKGKSGDYAVVDQQGQAVGYLPKSMGDRLAGAQAPQVQPGARPGVPGSAVNTTPVGAGASSPYAMASGTSNNLSGVTQPQQPSVAQSSGTP